MKEIIVNSATGTHREVTLSSEREVQMLTDRVSDSTLLNEYKLRQINYIKQIASLRILRIAPQWRQTNMLRDSFVLLIKGRDNWSAAELQSENISETVWDSIKQIRTNSDNLEALVSSKQTTEEVSAIKVHDLGHWS